MYEGVSVRICDFFAGSGTGGGADVDYHHVRPVEMGKRSNFLRQKYQRTLECKNVVVKIL